jgi:hypothetical protein
MLVASPVPLPVWLAFRIWLEVFAAIYFTPQFLVTEILWLMLEQADSIDTFLSF